MKKQELIEYIASELRSTQVFPHTMPMPQDGVPKTWREDIAVTIGQSGYCIRFDDQKKIIKARRKKTRF